MSELSHQNNNKDVDNVQNSTPGVKTPMKTKRKSTEDHQEIEGRNTRLRSSKRKKSESSPRIETKEGGQSLNKLCQTTSTTADTEISSALIVSKPEEMGSTMPSNNANSAGSSSSYASSDEEGSNLKIAVRKSRGKTNLTEETLQSSIDNSDTPEPKKRVNLSKEAKVINQEKLEEELKCSICSEIFIRAVTLNCSHSFCKYCIMTWRKLHSTCPICRQPIFSQNPTLVLDKCVEKVVECFDADAVKRRGEMVDYREKHCEQEPHPNGRNLNAGHYFGLDSFNITYSDFSEEMNSIADEYLDYQEFHWDDDPVYSSPAPSPPTQEEHSQESDGYELDDDNGDYDDVPSVSYTESELGDMQNQESDGEDTDDLLQSTMDDMEDDEFSDDERSSDESELGNRCFNCGEIGHMARFCPTAVTYTGIPGAYYGGYGVCFKCNQEGHWANGCPN